MSWLAANDYLAIEVAARDRADELTTSAATDPNSEVATRDTLLQGNDYRTSRSGCTVWSRALRLCPSEGR